MRSFIAATLLFASIGFAAPPAAPSSKGHLSPANPNYVRPPNKLPDDAVEALKSGVKFILFSLEPFPPSEEMETLKPEQKHYGFKILGSAELLNVDTKNSAIASITEAVKNFNGGSALCFSPRHSLRAISSKGKIYDFVTCFECRQIYVCSERKVIGRAGITGTQKPLDDILTAAKIPLAKPMEGEK
jgi:hypothetical protein